MNWLKVVTISALAFVFSFGSGCSMILVDEAPPEQMWPDVAYSICTTSLAWPVIDSILAGLNGLGTLRLMAEEGNGSGTSAVFAAGWTALHIVSASGGFSDTSNCKRYHLVNSTKRRSLLIDWHKIKTHRLAESQSNTRMHVERGLPLE